MLVLTVALEYRNLTISRAETLREARLRSTLVAQIIKDGITALMLKGAKPDPQHFLEPLVVEDEISTVRLMRPDGTVISSSNRAEIGSLIPPPSAGNLSFGKSDPRYTVNMDIYNERPCRKCHTGTGDIIATLSVEISAHNLFQKAARANKRSMLLHGITLLALLATLWTITRLFVTRPIDEINSIMRKVRDGDLKARYITGRTDEIGDLSVGLNSMLHELQATNEELQRCHAEDMQKAEKMASVGELAAAIAHDIKNPLAGISGAIQVFVEDFAPEDPRREIINEILSEIDRLDRSVKDLLSYAKPPEPNFIKTPVMPIIERVVRLISAQANKMNVNLIIKPEDEVNDIFVDPEQIQQVFLNIMLNAFHSMPQGGTLSISTAVATDSDMLEVAFSDTGMGIHEHNLSKIFKPFFTTRHTGTGLGLAIAKNTVERHGGKILIDSVTGVGSTFRILLPLGADR